MIANLSVILGIDPGLDGALALVDLVDGSLVDVIDMPTLQLKSGRELDEYRLAAWIDEHASGITEAWIEKVGARPGEGVANCFNFGRAYGIARGVVCANLISLQGVAPALWKRVMGVTGDKDESRKAASARWPGDVRRWPAKKDHGRCDACLIAAYGRRQFLAAHGAAPAPDEISVDEAHAS